jgi:subtilisin family serine protease
LRPLDLVKLTELMSRTRGRAEVRIGLIDGPVALDHPDLAGAAISKIGESGRCARAGSAACLHGTFVAGILCARRGSDAPAICPDCTLVVRPIFPEGLSGPSQMPSASADELADAIREIAGQGVRVINLSVGLAESSTSKQKQLERALDDAAGNGVHVVAAAGNQANIGSSAITRHPWVLPVVACDLGGRPIWQSNLGATIGRHGLCAPGEGITSLTADGKTHASGGTSVAAPFVSGTIALLWSEFPAATVAKVTLAVSPRGLHRRSVTPPLLDAQAAYQILALVP